MDPVRRKVLSVSVVVALLSLAAIGVLNVQIEPKNTEIDIIAQVNQNGSSVVFYEKDGKINLNDYRTLDETNHTVTFEAGQIDNWRGKVIGTPGVTTIQHTMLKTMVETKLGLKFEQHSDLSSHDRNTVYYHPKVANFSDWESNKNTIPDFLGCIIWEYVVSQVVENGQGVIAIQSDYMSKDHACCIIAARDVYLQNNWDATVRFLQSYIKGVKDVQSFITEKTVDPTFLDWAMKYTGQDKEITTNALLRVKYTYGTEGDEPLGLLKQNIVDFIEGANLKSKVTSQGYASTYEFVNELVNDKYLNAALDEETEVTAEDTTIKITTITGDIHQIALHWANAQGYFKGNHITLEIASGTNGAAVATSLQNGEADMGFMGVPPITSVVVNSKLNKPIHYYVSGELLLNGAPLKEAKLTLILGNDQKYECSTDSNGKFMFTVIKGTCVLDTGAYIMKVKYNDKEYYVNIKELERVESNVDLGRLDVIL